MDEYNKAIAFKLKYDEIMRKAAQFEKGGLRPRTNPHASDSFHPWFRRPGRELLRRMLGIK